MRRADLQNNQRAVHALHGAVVQAGLDDVIALGGIDLDLARHDPASGERALSAARGASCRIF